MEVAEISGEGLTAFPSPYSETIKRLDLEGVLQVIPAALMKMVMAIMLQGQHPTTDRGLLPWIFALIHSLYIAKIEFPTLLLHAAQRLC